MWEGRRKERLFESTRREKSKPSGQKQISQKGCCWINPFSQIEKMGFCFLADPGFVAANGRDTKTILH